MTTKTVALLLSSIASVAFSMAAFAEPAPAPAPAPAGAAATSPSEDNSIAEIVVTAEKRTENLETVPVAISAYTSKTRDLIGIETIQDITNFTPGLAYSTGLDRAFIRGIGRETNILATQPGVATYADGVYGYSVVAVSNDSMFQDRVEVLRGPQGTLYGRNSIGGTIDAISKHPTRDWEAEVRVNVGNYGVHNFEGSLSGPISDTMRFKFAGYKNDQTQGYYNNVGSSGGSYGGNGNYFYWEAQFEWDISPDVEFWLKADQLGYNQSYFFANTGGGYEYAPYGSFSLSPTPGFGLANGLGVTPANALTTNPGITNLHNISVSDVASNATLSRTYQITPQLTWHTPWASDLKYIGGYTTYYYNLHTDDNLTQNFNGADITSYLYPVIPGSKQCGGVDCPPLTVYPTPQFHYVQNESYYSNELNLTSHSDSSLQWIVGLYQYHETWDQPINITEAAQGNADKGCITIVVAKFGPNAGCLQTPTNATLTALAAPNPGNNIYWQEANMKGNSYAAFGQTDWKFLPTWKLTTGLRFTYDKLAGVESFRELCLGLPSCLGLSGYAPGAPPLPQYLLTGPALFGALTPVNDITVAAAGIANCATAAGCKYRGVTGLPTLNPANGFWNRGLSDHWDALTGTAGLEWTPDENTLAYLKYTRGYKSGGFNAGTITAAPESDPEHVDSLELGGKEVFNKTIQINGAFYVYDYKNLQDPLSVLPAGGGPAFTSIVNIPKVISFGAEFESIWQPIANLQLLLDYSYMDATIRSDFTVQNPVLPANAPFVDVKGQTVPQSPRHKVAANGNYTWRFTPGSLNFSASYIWKAKTYDSIFNQPYYLAPAYGQVDSRLSWNDAADRYTVFLYGKNLQNKIGYSNVDAQRVNTPAAGFPNYASGYELTPPRTYGIEIQYRLK